MATSDGAPSWARSPSPREIRFLSTKINPRITPRPDPPLPPTGPNKNAVVTSPVTMWLDAIDMAFARLAARSGAPSPGETPESSPPGSNASSGEDDRTWGRAALARVRALSVSGQQHGTVFWKTGASERLAHLANLGPRHTLLEVRAGSGSGLELVRGGSGVVAASLGVRFDPRCPGGWYDLCCDSSVMRVGGITVGVTES